MFLQGDGQVFGCRLVQEPAQLPGARPDAGSGKGIFLVAFQNALLGEREQCLSQAVGERELQTTPETLQRLTDASQLLIPPRTPWIFTKNVNNLGPYL